MPYNQLCHECGVKCIAKWCPQHRHLSPDTSPFITIRCKWPGCEASLVIRQRYQSVTKHCDVHKIARQQQCRANNVRTIRHVSRLCELCAGMPWRRGDKIGDVCGGRTGKGCRKRYAPEVIEPWEPARESIDSTYSHGFLGTLKGNHAARKRKQRSAERRIRRAKDTAQ